MNTKHGFYRFARKSSVAGFYLTLFSLVVVMVDDYHVQAQNLLLIQQNNDLHTQINIEQNTETLYSLPLAVRKAIIEKSEANLAQSPQKLTSAILNDPEIKKALETPESELKTNPY